MILALLLLFSEARVTLHTNGHYLRLVGVKATPSETLVLWEAVWFWGMPQGVMKREAKMVVFGKARGVVMGCNWGWYRKGDTKPLEAWSDEERGKFWEAWGEPPRLPRP